MSESRTRGDEAVPRHADDTLKPSGAEIRAELERVLASRCFQQAGRASHFLRFVVEQTLTGGGQRLKGYTIGVEVFGRPPDFDAQSDALVRVEAGRLRRRLVEYYASEGANDPVRIDLPRGSYAVECQYVRSAEALPASAALPTPAPPPAARAPWPRIAAALTVLLVVAAGVIAWQRASLNDARQTLAALGEPQSTEWPRIVVVPFENLGGDDTLDVVAASMTEEIMLRLDELDLFVVASQASWYGPSHEKGLDAGRGEGGYLLTGSVRGTAEQARITVRLIEAGSGTQLWTAAYDESLATEHLPVLQEHVARDVASIAAPYGPIFEAELARARRSVQAPKLRDCLVTYYEYRRRKVPSVHKDALVCFHNVSARQPDVAQVWSGIAMLYIDDYAAMFGRGGGDQLAAAREATAKALLLDPDDFLANLAHTRVQFYDDDPGFRQSIERTLALRPGNVQALAQGGFLLTMRGDAAHGLPLVQKARELSQTPPPLYYLAYAVAYMREGRFPEALAFAQKVDAQNWVVAQAIVAAAAAHSGREEIADKAAQRLLELYPAFEAEALANFEHWSFDPEYQAILVGGLKAAGLELREQGVALSGG